MKEAARKGKKIPGEKKEESHQEGKRKLN